MTLSDATKAAMVQSRTLAHYSALRSQQRAGEAPGSSVKMGDGTDPATYVPLRRQAAAARLENEANGTVTWKDVLRHHFYQVMAAAPGTDEVPVELAGLKAAVNAWLVDRVEIADRIPEVVTRVGEPDSPPTEEEKATLRVVEDGDEF